MNLVGGSYSNGLECTPESRQKVKQQTLRGVKWEKHVENTAGNSKYPFSGI